MITTASPCAWSRPAAIAISLPKLRLNETAPMRGSRALKALITASVSSALPSSTNTTSQAGVMRSSTGRSRAHRDAIPAASL